jgi:hypothetical protein
VSETLQWRDALEGETEAMPTFVSIVKWSGCVQPRIADLRRVIEQRGAELRKRGMHSLAFLPDEGTCTGIMVSTCFDAGEVERLAAAILPEADVRVESMMFEDGPDIPGWIARETASSPRRDFRRALLNAITSTSEV